MLEDYIEIEWGRAGIAGVMWLVVMAALWVIPKSMEWEAFPIGQRIVLTVLSLPVIYIVLSWQAGRD